MEDILPSSLNKIAIYTSNNLTNSITNITQQLNTVPNKITGTFENALDNDLTPNKILLTNSTGKLVESSGTVTSTDLEYLKGLTSPVKTQLTNTSNYAKTVSDGTIANLNGVNTEFNLEGKEVILPFIKDNSTTNPQPIQINDTDYYYAFTSTSGTNFITFPEETVCDVLIVGGGGSGGNRHGGGGGAGGYIYNQNVIIPSGTYNITVGAGGAGTISGRGTSGNNSTLSGNGITTLTAFGGGAGGYWGDSISSLSGGCGGGGGGTNTVNSGSGGIGSQGGNGGSSYIPSESWMWVGAGGGGCGGDGQNATSTTAGDGGIGISNNITGTLRYYGGGGGGGAFSFNDYGIGGNGGGGNGSHNTSASNGVANTGGGGGGVGVNNGVVMSGAGGSGIVIIRWKVGEPKFIPEAVAMSNGNIIEHKPVSGSDEYVYVEFTEESIKYPTITSITWYSSVLYGGVGSVYNPSQLFNNTTGGIGTSWPENYYNHTTGYFDPGYSGTIAAGHEYNPSEYRSDYLGCWFSFDNNESIILGSVRCYPRSGYSKRLPKEFRIYGTNDANIFNNGSQDISNNSWEMIAECKNTSYFSSVPDGLDFAVENKYNKSFRYYLIIVNRIFANNSALNFTELELYVKQSITFEKSTNIDYIVVGAGGSGGYAGGGAGGGDVIAGNITLSKGQYNIVVAETTSKSSSNGGNHSSISSLLEHFDTIWGCGGKGGSSYNARGSYRSSPSSTSAGGGAGNGLYGDSLNGRESLNNLSGYGGKLHNDGSNSLVHSGGGGGSLTTPYGDGQDGTAIKSGDGGSGTQTFIRGIEEYFGGGGGGAVHYTGHGIEAIGLGKHGGGNGGVTTSTGISAVAATHGQANTGGGGGGGANYGQLWGYGGSGIVIIRWKKQKSSEITTFSNKLLEDLSAVTLDNVSTEAHTVSEITYDYIKYPRENMSSNSKTYTDGTVVQVKASSQWNGYDHAAYTSFNGNQTDYGWGTNNGIYNNTSGEATTSYVNGYNGEWLMIDLGESIILGSFKFYPRSGFSSRMPRTFRLYASTNSNAYTNVNDNNWNEIYTYDDPNQTFTTAHVTHYITNNTTSYRYYFIVVNRVYLTGQNGMVQIAEMELYHKTAANKYPRENMAGYSKTYTDGTVVQVKASTKFNDTDESPWSSFDGSDSGKGWASATSYSSGNATANYLTGYTGEWIMIDLGESIKLDRIKIYPRVAALNRFPKTFRLYASNKAISYTNGVNDLDWVKLIEYNDTINTTKSNTSVTVYVTSFNQNEYRYYFMVINKTYGENSCQFSELELYKNSISETHKLIQNNTYSGDLAINGKLTVSNDMLISGVTADLFSTSFTQESLEISALTTDSLLNIKQSGSGNILELQSGGVSKVTITNNGNIGIGKTNPSTILDVAGNVKATSYYINGSQLSYNHIANKPTVFNPASHTHPISDITNLQTSLDNKQPNIPVMSYNSGTNIITIDADVVLTADKKYQINGTDILENANYVTATSGSGGTSTTSTTIEDTYWKQRASSMPAILDNNSNVSAKQINSHTYYYDFTNICKYPRENMSAASKTYADGTVVQVKASTNYPGEDTFLSFNGNINDTGWGCGNNKYTASTGNAITTYLTGYAGEWLMIDLGESITLHSFKLFCRLSTSQFCNRMPRKFRLYGAINSAAYTDVNNANWNLIYEYYDSLNSSTNENPVYHYLKGNNISYRYYFIIINQVYINSTSVMVQFAEMEFYAKRHSITFLKDTYCDVLLIGGGGSGGCGASGAGGGAGECRYIQNHLFTSGTYNIIVGKGGISKTTNTGFGYKGDDSYIVKDGDTEDFLRAYGGGAGGQGTLTDTSTIVGGSSGGVGTTITVYSPDPSGNMQGLANKGGTGINNLGGFYAGGGGGGAGSAGGNALYFTNPASMCYAGQGGYGVKLDITGEYKYYAAGGGGSVSSGNFTSKTVLGIGGATNQSGVDGTGSGGGGTSASSGTSGKGGNGIVIIRWNSFENENNILYNNIELYNNNVIIENQKYFNDFIKYGDIQKYPPGPMTANTTTLSGYSYGNGTYIVSASSAHNIATAGDVWNLFDSNSSSFNFPNTRYNITTGSSNANTATLEGTFYVGEWIKIQMPQQIYLHHIKFIPRTSGEGLLSRSPNIYRIYASNDGSRWKMLLNNTTTAIYHTEKESCYHNTEIPYLQNNDKYFYFAICVNSLYGGDIYSDYFNIIEIEIYGSESFVNSKNSNNVASLQKSIVVGEGNVLLYNGNIQANTMNANHCTVKEQLNINKCITPYQKYPILHNHTLSNPANLEYKFTYSDGTPEFKFKVSSQYNSNTGYHNWSIDKSFDGIFNGSITNWTITGWTTANSTYSSGNAANTYKTGYAGEWLMYDMGVSKTLKQLKIYPYNFPSNLNVGINRQPKSFRIYASNTASAYSNINDASWLQIYEGYNTNSDEYVKTYNITNNINYRYYSIVFNQKVNSTDGDTNISINELEFYYEIKDDINNYVERYPKMYNDLYLVRSTDTDIASNKTISSYVSSKAYKYTYSNSLNRYPTFRFQCSNYRTDWSTGLPCFYCFDEYLQHADNTTVETNRNYGWNTPAYYTNQVTINSVIYRHYAGSTEHISGYKGEWIMFDMGIPKNLKKFVFGVDSNNTSRQPGEFRLYGSNHLNAYRAFNTYPGTFTSVGSNTYKVGEGDNDGWEKLYDGYNTVNNNVKKSYDLYNNIKYYQYYLIIVNKTLQGDSYLSISEIELYTALDMITTSWNIEGDIVNDLTFTLTNKYNEKNIICEFDGSKTNTGQYTNFTGVHHCKSENKELYSKKYIGYIVSSQNKYQKMNSMYSPENIQRNMDNEEWDYLPIVDLSRKQNDKNSFGVICKIEDDNSTKRYINTGHLTHYYDKKEYDRRLHIAGVGEGGIWICDCNGQLEAGDYITTSHIPGIGMKQTDDIQHNYTVAKITMDCDFYPQQIPLKKLNDEGVYENIYDNDGNIVYEKQYDIKYIKESGEIIDDINAYYMSTLYDSVETPEKIYKIAFVGCSYNCS